MEINSAIVYSAPRDAATVVILRDTPGVGLEVFMVRRHSDSAVMGGAYVFPGGKLDDSDLQLDEAAHLDQSSSSLQSALAEAELTPQRARGLYVAALREAFEECGVLFADGGTQAHSRELAQRIQPLGGTAATPDAAPPVTQGEGFNSALQAMGLRLQTRALRPWSRWVTPKMPSFMRRRFDTRFFVAPLPADQLASHDNYETTESVWLPPRLALQRYWDQGIEMAPPQIMTLAHLSRFADVASVLRAAASQTPALIEPEPFDDNGERVVCYPGDPRHSIPTLAMPGPTRLRHRNQRFEPEGGFEALFA